jgi:hypothetical protein
MTYLKSIRIAGFCLVAMFAVSMYVSSSAMATWEDCSTEKAAEAKSKYTTNQCTTASSTGGWAWQEVKGTDEVVIKGTLKLLDTKTLAGVSEVECFGESKGAIGPGQFGRINTVKVEVANCRAIKVCEKVEEIEARNLPWQTEDYNTEGKHLSKLTGAGSGEPGWKVKCKTVLGSKTDECLAEAGEPESLQLENRVTNGELLVLVTFQHLRKAKCTEGGAKSGEVLGSVGVLLVSKGAIRIS